ncbi:MAG TPA: IS1634 family transposase [Opitutaceae bacterium]|jgi:hypothetical protein
MFLKCRLRRKDGKTHRSWSIVESRRYGGNKVAHRHVLYLGEINDSQRLAWERAIAVVDERDGETREMALFPEDRAAPPGGVDSLQVRLSELRLERPRQWGGCWLADQLWQKLRLDQFFGERLGDSREGTEWEKVVRILAIYRLLSPGSEWRLHRHWFETTALADLLGVDGRAVQDDTLYRGLDLLLAHKEALFGHLQERWRDLFGARYEVLLYDLTSTYFECDVPQDERDPRRFGYSRDKRGDCVQVVIALVVTPEGLPLAYEMMPGNTADKTTLRGMLTTIARRYGPAWMLRFRPLTAASCCWSAIPNPAPTLPCCSTNSTSSFQRNPHRGSGTRRKLSQCSPDLSKMIAMDQRLAILLPPSSGSRAISDATLPPSRSPSAV